MGTLVVKGLIIFAFSALYHADERRLDISDAATRRVL